MKKRLKRRAPRKKKNGILGKLFGAAKAAHAKRKRRKFRESMPVPRAMHTRRQSPIARGLAKRKGAVKAAADRGYTDVEIRQMIKDRDPRISARPHRKNPNYSAINAIDKKIDAVRRELRRREKIQTSSWLSWGNAWAKHPDLRKKEEALFIKRDKLRYDGEKKNPECVSSPNFFGTVKRVCKNGKKARKRNSAEGLVKAANMYEKFHGKPAGGVITVQEQVIARKDYSKLGDMEKLEIDGEHTICFAQNEGTILACDPKGRQLYIIGGSQNIDSQLAKLGVDPTKDFIDLGECTQIEYFTRKGFDNFKPVTYYHEFGEETGQCPRLMYDRLNKRLYLVGGEYEVKPEGVVN